MSTLVLYNPSKMSVYDFRFNGKVGTIEDNQIREFDEDLAVAMIAQYDFLQVVKHDERSIMEATVADNKTPVEQLEKEVKELELEKEVLTGKEAFEKSLEENLQFHCSVCAKIFDKRRGLNLHIRKVHEVYAKESKKVA